MEFSERTKAALANGRRIVERNQAQAAAALKAALSDENATTDAIKKACAEYIMAHTSVVFSPETTATPQVARPPDHDWYLAHAMGNALYPAKEGTDNAA